MNKTITKFLLAGEKFMPELHLRQPGFTNCICGPFTKHSEKIQTFKEVGNLNIFIEINLTKLVLLVMLCILTVNI